MIKSIRRWIDSDWTEDWLWRVGSGSTGICTQVSPADGLNEHECEIFLKRDFCLFHHRVTRPIINLNIPPHSK